jgi:hypothetical protein
VSAQLAQAAQVIQPTQSAITLDPPTGSELQTHTFDSKGTRLPEAPANFRRIGEARVGETADAHTLTLRFAQTTSLTGIKTSRDFRVEPGGSCDTGNTYQKGTTCTVLVRFTPQGAGNRLGSLTVSTNVSATPMAFGLGGYGYAPIISFIPAQISTVPGTYPSSVGLLSGAQNLTIDSGDTMWISDTGNGLIRQMDSSGVFRTFASGYTGAVGIAVDTFGEAYFDVPSTGKMYEIYDYGPVVQVSGTGTTTCPASAPCTLSSEALGAPGEMSMDPYNHLFFADSHSGAAFSTVQPEPANLIFLYDPFPYQTSPSSAMAADAGDNLYSLWVNSGACEIVQQSLYNAENNNVSFTKIAGGHTCGYAGEGGLAGNAEIGAKIGQIAFDMAGDMYFTDTANRRVRRIEYTTGIIRNVAGNGVAGYTGDGGTALGAELSTPTGVGVDSTGSVYIISSAGSGQVIRKVGPNGYVSFGNQSKGTSSVPIQVKITNTGNSAMTLTSWNLAGANAGDFAIASNFTSCLLTAGATLYSGQTCYLGIKFTPSAVGTRTATLSLLDNTVSGTNAILLSGAGVLPAPTFTITSPANGASFTSGTAVPFSVSVTYSSSPQPTGTVQFKVDGANYGGPVTLSSTGTASTSVTGLTQTTHSLSATYSGDANYAAAGPISVSITVTAVKLGTLVSLAPAVRIGIGCSPTQFQAAVTAASGPAPTGTVELFDGTSKIASGSLTNGSALLSSPPLGAGSHTLTAHYAGDSLHLPGVSPALVEVGSATSSCSPTLIGKPTRRSIPAL